MRRVYLSFLGTNKYLVCNYEHKCFAPVQNVRFVQEATISWHCRDWSRDDEILFFLTDEARLKNWRDNGHTGKNVSENEYQGLESKLKDLRMDIPFRAISIPVGKNEGEIWDIFSIIVEQLQENDVLYFDITHAFRSLPLLATVVVNYAKVVRNIQVQAICYGAMEALGSYRDVEKLDVSDRNIPVFDLLPFDHLLDWSTAIDKFLASGDSTGVKMLTEQKARERKKEVRGPDDEADGVWGMARKLDDFSRNLASCRGRKITASARELKMSIKKVMDQDLVRPLSPLLEKLKRGIAEFTGDEVGDGIAAAGWCLDHNLVQQGFTILQETIITFVFVQAVGGDAGLVENRNLVGMAVSIEQNDIPFEKWKQEAQTRKNEIVQISEWLRARHGFLESMNNLSADRNDLNHAGMNPNPMSAARFEEKLKEYLAVFSRYVDQAAPQGAP